MSFFDTIFQQESDTAKKKRDREKAENEGFKFNPVDLILSLIGVPPVSNIAGAASGTAMSGVSGIPIVGDILSGMLGAKQAVPDLLDEAINATDPKSPTSGLDALFADLKMANTSAMSAAPSVPGVDLSTPSGGNETLNDIFRLLRKVAK